MEHLSCLSLFAGAQRSTCRPNVSGFVHLGGTGAMGQLITAAARLADTRCNNPVSLCTKELRAMHFWTICLP
jgi:hypothetical protein